jgi:hypothetical protein
MDAVGFDIGDLVVLLKKDWEGAAGIVSWPITHEEEGFVLVYSDGRVAGVRVAAADVEPAESSTKGFTQLAYHLIKLSSHLIEGAIL